jgi:hypothetical protein
MPIFERRSPSVDVNRLKLWVYGPPKSGKSSLFSGMKDAVYLDFDAGLGALDVVATPVITDWAMAGKAYLELREQVKDGGGPRTVIIDTVDAAYDMICGEVLAEANAPRVAKGQSPLRHISDMPYGAGWFLARQKLEKWLNALYELGCGVYMISHTKDEERDLPSGLSLTRTIPAMGGRAADVLGGWVDALMYLTTAASTTGKVDLGPDGQAGKKQSKSQRSRDEEEVRFAGVEYVLYTHASPYLLAGGRYMSALPPVISLAPPPEGWSQIVRLLESAFSAPEKKAETEPVAPMDSGNLGTPFEEEEERC